MQPIIPTIHPGETGPHVANLQDALIALLGLTPEKLETLSVDIRRERARSTFGEATYNLVIAFQVQQVLNDNLGGVVEDTTAAKLNELLKFFGVLDETIDLAISEHPAVSGNGEYVVRGIVRGGNRLPYSGALVLAYHSTLQAEVLIGKDKTRSDGNYRITYSPKRFSGAGKQGASLRV